MGRGIGTQHRSGNGPSAIPIVGLDHFYITGGGVKFRNELEQPDNAAGNAALNAERHAGTIVKCLLVRCMSTKAVFAHCVPAKGATEDQYVSSLVVSRVEWLGHTRLILKADNEPALRTLVEQSLEEIRIKTHIEQVTAEHPPAYHSQANGGIETGVRIFRGLFRALKLCLEARIGKIVQINHALIPWLLQHTSSLLNLRYTGRHG